jgi:hypothetical protein
MPPTRCPELVRLESEVGEALNNLVQLTKAQLEAFQDREQEEFMRLNKELENVVGLKERRVGAQRQHVREHGCQETAISGSLGCGR